MEYLKRKKKQVVRVESGLVSLFMRLRQQDAQLLDWKRSHGIKYPRKGEGKHVF